MAQNFDLELKEAIYKPFHPYKLNFAHQLKCLQLTDINPVVFPPRALKLLGFDDYS